MSRNQLLAIIGVLLVLGVAFQRSPVFQSSQSVSCMLCPGWVVQIVWPGRAVPGAGISRGANPALSSGQNELSEMGRAGWFATPEPLSEFVPTTTSQHTQQPWHSRCLDC